MQYTKTVDFNGNTATAFAVVTGALTASGFRLIAQDGRRLQFTRTACFTGREGWSPFRGISAITITASSRQLSLEAESGSLGRKVGWIVVPVAAAAVAIGGAIAKVATRPTPWTTDKLLQVFAVVLPLVIISIVLPLALRFAGRRSNDALDLIVENAALAARASG